MQLVVDSAGVVRCVYDETIDLSSLGSPRIARASHVEPDATGWSSVIAFGSVEFVRDPAGYLTALKALRRQRGYAGSVGPKDALRMARACVMRIVPTEITGRTKA